MTVEAPKIEPAKPCPFCGSENVQFERSEPVQEQGQPVVYYWINCRACDATGPSTTTAAYALGLWNGRKPLSERGPPG